MTTDKPRLGVGMIGYAFMGAAHSQAWRTVNRVFDLPARASMVAVCGRDAAKVAENVRTACNAAGAAAAQRAATWSLRTAGARLAERSANGGPPQAAALQRLVDIQRRAFECAEAGNPVALALESADPAVRSRAVGEWEKRLVRDAQVGEVAACAGTTTRDDGWNVGREIGTDVLDQKWVWIKQI